jgi:cobalamin synthase
MWISFALALRILTNIPVSVLGSPSPTVVRRAIVFFPLVGAIVGAVSGAGWMLAARLWPGQLMVAAAFAMLIEMVLTGARGLGGVGRSADALFSLQEETDRSKAIALLRDPRRNTPSVAATAILALLKASLLASLRPESAWLALIVAGCLGEWAVAFSFTLFRLLPAWNNADIEGNFAGAGMNEFVGAMALAVFGAAILPVRGLLALAVIAVIVGPIARSIDRAFNGLNVYFGYALGYIAQIVAVGMLAIHGV